MLLILDVLVLKDVLCEAHYVSDWKTLGVHLGLPHCEIRLIDAKNRGDISHCKIDLFQAWLNSDPNASWLSLGQALLQTPDHHDMGLKILRTHCPSSLPSLASRSGGKVWQINTPLILTKD